MSSLALMLRSNFQEIVHSELLIFGHCHVCLKTVWVWFGGKVTTSEQSELTTGQSQTADVSAVFQAKGLLFRLWQSHMNSELVLEGLVGLKSSKLHPKSIQLFSSYMFGVLTMFISGVFVQDCSWWHFFFFGFVSKCVETKPKLCIFLCNFGPALTPPKCLWFVGFYNLQLGL